MIIIQESGLSRLTHWMDDYDCGTITAFRGEYNRADNLKRNKSLQTKLLAKNYNLTVVKGAYIENMGTSKEKEVKEDTFFVVDAKERGTLKADLKKLGEEFDQDSILFIPKGGESSLLIGTSKKDGMWPAYGKEEKMKARKMGKSGEFMTRVSGRPFIFEKIDKSIEPPNTKNGKWGMSLGAKKPWQEIED